MDKISGIFNAVYQPAGYKTAGSFFLAVNGGLPVLVSGAAPDLKKGTPINVYGKSNPGGTGGFTAEKIEFNTADRDSILAFFNGRHFHGLSKKTGELLFDALRDLSRGSDVTWDKFPDFEIHKICSSLQFDSELTANIIHAVTGIQRRYDIMKAFRKTRITHFDVEILYSRFFGDAVSEMRKDPYAMLPAGASFAFCDDTAYENGVKAYENKRIRAFLLRMADTIRQSGSCCMRLDEALSMLQIMQKKSRFHYIPTSLFLSEMLKSTEFILKETAKYGIVVYPEKLYRAEKAIVAELARLNADAAETGYEVPEDTGYLDAGQVQALSFLKTEGVKILTGGPGAGKTTTIMALVRGYRSIRPKDPVMLCAPTGRAAVRISESMGEDNSAMTIHKLLDARMLGNKTMFTFNKENPLPKGLYIADEMSMADELLFLNLIRALPQHSILILSGDPNQLPSVQAGTVLKDLAESGAFHHIRLTGNHRQQDGNLIIENYNRILQKNPKLSEGREFTIIRTETEKEAGEAAVSLYHRYAMRDPQSAQLLCSVKMGESGKNMINEKICAGRPAGPEYAGYMPGDKIMMTRNNYQGHYWNGDTGIVTSVGRGYISASFYDGTREITDEYLPDTEHAFAMTIHKSQGSEYDTVIIVLGKRAENMLSNALILTAVTRAKKRVFIVSEQDALEISIVTNREAKRITGLQDMIQESLPADQRPNRQSSSDTSDFSAELSAAAEAASSSDSNPIAAIPSL